MIAATQGAVRSPGGAGLLMALGLDGGVGGALLAGMMDADPLVAAAVRISGLGGDRENLRAGKREEEDETPPTGGLHDWQYKRRFPWGRQQGRRLGAHASDPGSLSLTPRKPSRYTASFAGVGP